MKVIAGWSAGSKMPSIYVHLSGEDLDKKLLAKKGLLNEQIEQPTTKVLEPKKCSRCGTVNPADFKFCGKCSMALDCEQQ